MPIRRKLVLASLIMKRFAINQELMNVQDALDDFPGKSIYAWLDVSNLLHWIKGAGEYNLSVTVFTRLETEVVVLEASTNSRKSCRSGKSSRICEQEEPTGVTVVWSNMLKHPN